jgi:hypothetical protein
LQYQYQAILRERKIKALKHLVKNGFAALRASLIDCCVQVYYSTNPQLPLSQWESQFVDNNKLTTISDLTPHTIYTIRVEAYTSIGPGPLSSPVQVFFLRSSKA